MKSLSSANETDWGVSEVRFYMFLGYLTYTNPEHCQMVKHAFSLVVKDRLGHHVRDSQR
jgi:hypothetical protein